MLMNHTVRGLVCGVCSNRAWNLLGRICRCVCIGCMMMNIDEHGEFAGEPHYGSEDDDKAGGPTGSGARDSNDDEGDLPVCELFYD